MAVDALLAGPRPPWRLLPAWRLGVWLSIYFCISSSHHPTFGAPWPRGRALLVADSSLDRVVRLEDRDGSGTIDPVVAGDALVFYDDASPGPDLSTPSGVASAPDGTVFLLDGGTLDAVLRLSDRNGDGDANDDGEVLIFYNASSPGPNLSTPNSLVYAADGTLYLADDGKLKGLILGLKDKNGDGDALDDGEWWIVYDSQAVEGSGAPLPVLGDIEALAVTAAGALFVTDATQQAVARLQDLNGDGDAMDAGEAALFYQPQGAHPFADPEGIAVNADGEVFATDEDTGLVVRLFDSNGDGRAEGAGEVRIFVDATAPAFPRDTNDLMARDDGVLLVLDGSRDQVFWIADGDGDGIAFSPGEVEPLLITSGEDLLGTPSAIAEIPSDLPEAVVIASIEPNEGKMEGGNQATVRGHFPGHERRLEVRFGVNLAAVTAAALDQIQVVAPPAAAPGPVDVAVATAQGQAVLLSGYRYVTAVPPAPGPYLLVADSSLDRIVRLQDRDNSGLVDPNTPGEVFIFYDDASPGPDLSTPSGMALGDGSAVFLLDGGTLDAVLALKDNNGDGDANDDGEFAIFYDDTSSGPDLSTPNSLARADNGTLYLADDGQAKGLVLGLKDRNGNGDALDEDEWWMVYDSEQAAAASPLLPVLGDIEGLAVGPGGTIYVTDATLQVVARLEDLNGDGDALDGEEVKIVYDPRGAHAFADPEGIAVGASGEVYVTDEDIGLIVRLEDLNRDGRFEGSQEAMIWVDASAPLPPRDTNDLLAVDGALLALDGTHDQVYRLSDLDGDGAALSSGEVEPVIDPAAQGVLGTPSALVEVAPAEKKVLIASVEPSEGKLAGGNPAAIRGQFPGHEQGVEVRFGANRASVVEAKEDRLQVVVPAALQAGPVAVQVTIGQGQAVLANGYRYLSESKGFVRGNINGDDRADLSDAVGILSYLFLGSAPPGCLDAADVDDDGDIAITDAIYLLTHLFLGSAPPPPPYPDPGDDPTADSLPCGP
ncbi:MAG: hypothetical protein HY717_15150 [Planctomycetes bacterium]|nr:hypothetical protein [Planctomycetota bacterium]